MFTHAKSLAAPAIVLASLALGACAGGPVGGQTATLADNRHQCRDYDWFQVGLRDGIRGYEDAQERFNALAANCSQHGAVISEDLYFSGYAEGRQKAGGG
ncbi:MAG: DUF2799 domain-containing protein [Pseudomonadota bacterium]